MTCDELWNNSCPFVNHRGGHNATTRRYPTVLIQNLRHHSGLVGWWVRSESSKRFLRVCAVGFGDWFWARRKPNPTESKGIFMARPNLNRNIIKHSWKSKDSSASIRYAKFNRGIFTNM